MTILFQDQFESGDFSAWTGEDAFLKREIRIGENKK